MLVALLQNLAGMEDDWHKAVVGDLTTMHVRLPQMARMPDPQTDGQAWLDFARDWPTDFKTLAKRLQTSTAAADLALGVAPPSAANPRLPPWSMCALSATRPLTLFTGCKHTA